MKCIICKFDDRFRPPPGGQPREAVYVVNGMSTCDEHLGEALTGGINQALSSISEQMRKRDRI